MSKTLHKILPAWFILALLALAGCGGKDTPPEPPPPAVGSATLGVGGGTVAGPDGVLLELPADALTAPVTLRIARDGSGAPELLGLNAAAPVYALTPHGQAFEAGAALSIPLSAVQLPAGATPLLLKADPGGAWRILPNVSSDPARLAVDLDGLSYYTVGFCSSTPNDAWTIGGVDCPSAHSLQLTLFDANGQRILRGNSAVPVPWMTITDTPRILHMRLDWLRPAGITRTDQLSVVGLPGGFNSSGFTTTWPTPAVIDVPDRHSRSFSVTIDPARVAGASSPNGRLLRIKGYASYSATAFRVGQGNVAVGFIFEAEVPVLVRYNGPLPTITQQPTDVGVNVGQSASFTVATASGTASLQWQRRAGGSGPFADIGGATAATYSLSNLQLADDGSQVRVTVCSAPTRCVDSNIATLSVTLVAVAPVFGTQPADLAVVAGQTASFNVTASGVPLPQVRWQSAAAGSTNFADVSGALACATTQPTAGAASVGATCTVGPLLLADNGRRYRAVAVNASVPAGVASNFATVTVAAAPVAPVITQQPAAQSTAVGGSATFSVTATGTAPLAYAWRLGGSLPSVSSQFAVGSCTGSVTYSNGGATASLSNLSAACAGLIASVVVSNGINPDATSNGATLTLVTRPTITLSPQSQSVDIGQTANFSVGASGPNLTYQWQRVRRNGINPDNYPLFEDIPGATSASYVTPPATMADDQSLYAVRVCIGPAVPGNFANCWFLGIAIGAFDEVRMTVNPVTSQAFALVASGSTQNLNAVAFANAFIGVAVGDNGTLLRTIDGGLTWAAVSSGTSVNLLGVALASNGNGVAVGAETLLRTTNHGASWTATDLASGGLCCADVAMADANTVLVARGTFNSFGWGFLRSTDAGQTYARAGTQIDSSRSVRFGSASNGAALARGQIHYTVDGGANWAMANQPSGQGALTLVFASASLALASDGGRLMRSSDGGRNWNMLYGGGITRASNALAFNGAGVGLAVGDGPSYGAMRSPDFGQTWVPLLLPGASGSLFGLAFADANVAVAVGANGTIVRFAAGGL